MENNQQNKIDDVLEIVSYIKDNAASKADLLEVKSDLSGLGNRVGNIESNMATKEDVGRLSVEIVNIKEVMATKEDVSRLDLEIVNIKETMATKEDVSRLSLEIVSIQEKMATKEELSGIDVKFNKMIDSIDRLTKKVDDYFQEAVSTSRALKRHENWIQQLAAKLEIKLEY